MNIQLRKVLRTSFFIVGCLFFYIMCKRIGFAKIVENIYKLPWYDLLIILSFPLSWRILQSLGFYILCAIPGSKWRHFLEAQITSIAVGDVFPVGALGGEIYRVLYLKRKYPTQGSKLFASLILYNTFYGIAVVVFLISTILYLTVTMHLEPIFKTIILSIVGLLAFLLIFILVLQAYGMFSLFLKLFSKVKWLQKRLAKVLHQIEEVDTVMMGYIGKHPFRFLTFFILLFSSRFCAIGEVIIIGHFIGFPFTLTQAILLTVIDTCVQTFLFFAPGGQLGFMEGAINAASLIINKPMFVTMTLSIFKRLRSIFWDFIGLILIYFNGNSITKETKKEITKRKKKESKNA